MELFFVFIVLSIIDAQTIVNPCRTYTNITDRSRDVNNQPRQTDVLLCDQFEAPGWFRFQGGLMPTSCQQPFRCGTQAPIWLRGSVPLVSEGVVDRVACANTHPDDVGPEACCGTQIPIQIRNCGGFVVYFLLRTPACPMAYCTESPPRLLSPPQLTGPEVISNTFRFGCNVSFQKGVQNIAFNVTWFFDGVPIPGQTTTLSGDERIAFLEQEAWRGNMGKTLRCRVDTFYTTMPSLRKEPEDSNGYWGGIVTTPSTMIISEAEGPRQVNVTSTLPILCKDVSQCDIRISIDVRGDSWQDIATLERCTLVLRSQDWNAVTRTATATTGIIATRDVVQDGDQRLQIRFNPIFSSVLDIWNGFSIPPISVYTVDQETRRCLAFGDPHIRGLERDRVIHLFDTGDYVLFRSTTRTFEVNIRTFPCAGLSCICAVAIQDGNDVLSINICGNDWWAPPARVRLLSEEQLSPGTTIQRSTDGRNFMMSFASGGWVRVIDLQGFLNIEIQVPAQDFGHTLGLCGTFDGNPDNEFTSPDGRVFVDNTDFPTEFLESWRLNVLTSLINGAVRPQPDNRVQVAAVSSQCLCHADVTIVNCAPNRSLQDPALLPCLRCTDITTTVRRENNTDRNINDDINLVAVVPTRTQIRFNFTVEINADVLGIRPSNNLPRQFTPQPAVPPTWLPPSFNTPRQWDIPSRRIPSTFNRSPSPRPWAVPPTGIPPAFNTPPWAVPSTELPRSFNTQPPWAVPSTRFPPSFNTQPPWAVPSTRFPPSFNTQPPWAVPSTRFPPSLNSPRFNFPRNIPLFVPGATDPPRTTTRALRVFIQTSATRPGSVPPSRGQGLTPQTLYPIITADIANRVCFDAMMNFSIGIRCVRLSGFHIHAYVNACVTDMLAAQSNFFLQAAVSAMESGCQEVVFRNITNYGRNRQGTLLPPPDVTSFVCPNQCSLRGICIQGNCVCDAEYTSYDCSVLINRPPRILRILRNGVCDARRRTCLISFLQVENVMQTPNISCRVRDVRITNGQMNPGSVFMTVNADLDGTQEVACALPDPRVPEDIGFRGYLISLTIDGVVYSNEILYLVFDSTCLSCNRQGRCGIRNDTCFIDNICRQDGERNSADNSLFCDPDRTQEDWSRLVADVEVRSVPFCAVSSRYERWDIWTSNRTGCSCMFDISRTDCACCEEGGCQCSQPNQNQCALCGQEGQQCGRRQSSPQFGLDGWTKSLTGCRCVFNRSRNDCACCQNNGCQCTVEHRNQCSPCGVPDVCGSKPDVFGALRTEI